MTIKGSLQVSIAIVKALWRKIFCRVKNYPKICVFGEIGPKCKILFSEPPKGHFTYWS